MAICCVIGCSNKTEKPTTENGKRVSFHRFPNRDKSPNRHQAWVEKVHRDVFKPTKFTLVCSVHFNDDDYEKSAALKQQFGLFENSNHPPHPVLKKTAIPTKHLTVPIASAAPCPVYWKRRKAQPMLPRKLPVEPEIVEGLKEIGIDSSLITYPAHPSRRQRKSALPRNKGGSKATPSSSKSSSEVKFSSESKVSTNPLPVIDIISTPSRSLKRQRKSTDTVKAKAVTLKPKLACDVNHTSGVDIIPDPYHSPKKRETSTYNLKKSRSKADTLKHDVLSDVTAPEFEVTLPLVCAPKKQSKAADIRKRAASKINVSSSKQSLGIKSPPNVYCTHGILLATSPKKRRKCANVQKKTVINVASLLCKPPRPIEPEITCKIKVTTCEIGIQCQLIGENYNFGYSNEEPSSFLKFIKEENIESDEDNDFVDECYDGDFMSENGEMKKALTQPVNSLPEKRPNYNQFLVLWDCLEELFVFCTKCGSHVQNLEQCTTGPCLTIKIRCINGHVVVWNSQRTSSGHEMENVRIAASMCVSEMSFSAFQAFANTINMHLMCEEMFVSIIKRFVSPAINQTWTKHNLKMIYNLKMSKVDLKLVGDGQADWQSCGEYFTYIFMDVNTGNVIDFIVLQKDTAPSSVEKSACEKLLARMTSYDLPIKVFLSDCHQGIKKLMHRKYPDISHEFDVWHVSKRLSEKVEAGSKKVPALDDWKESILNHLWWCVLTRDENEEKLVEKFTSILEHVSNRHNWSGRKYFHGCVHKTLSSSEELEKGWLKEESCDYKLLSSIINDTDLISDLKRTKSYYQTGRLESYRNVRVKYIPKKSCFSYEDTVLRTMLSILDYNLSTGYSLSHSMSGDGFDDNSARRSICNTWRGEIVEKACALASGDDNFTTENACMAQTSTCARTDFQHPMLKAVRLFNVNINSHWQRSPRRRGCTKMVLLPPKTAPPCPEIVDADPEEGPFLVLAAPSPPGTKGPRLLVQEVFKDKMAAMNGKMKKPKATVAPSGCDASNESGEVDTVSVTKPDPNEERTQVSINTSLQPAKTNTDSEPLIHSPIMDKVQETWDTDEVNATSTPIAAMEHERHTPEPMNTFEPPSSLTDGTLLNQVVSESLFVLEETVSSHGDLSRSTSTTAVHSEEGRRSLDVPPTKPVWMKQKKKRMSSSNKKKRVKGSKRLDLTTPSMEELCDCDKVSCCELNAEWIRTGNVKYRLFDTLKNMEREILYFKDLAFETRDRMSCESFPQSDDLLCLKVADKMKRILPKMRHIFQDFDSGYIKCVNCDLGKMIFNKIIGLRMHFENFETQLLSQGLYYFMCYVKEFVEPCDKESEPLCNKILSTFESEYAGSVLLYHGYPKAFYAQSLYASLKKQHKIRTKDNVMTVFECMPTTICFRVILSLKHTMMDLKMYLGIDVKEVHCSRSPQVVVDIPPKDESKPQLINSRKHLRRELFKPAPLPCVPLAKESNINETKTRNLAKASPKCSASQNTSHKRSAEKAVNKNKSSKNTNYQTVINSITEENIGSKTSSRVLKEPIDKREVVRREMERESRNRLPKCYRLRKAARSTSSPATMITVKSINQKKKITENVKSTRRVCSMCTECVFQCQLTRFKQKRCLTTDDINQPKTFKNRQRNVTGIFEDVTKMPPHVIKDLLNILLMDGDAEQSMLKTQGEEHSVYDKGRPFSDETSCWRKIESIRNIVNNYEICLPKRVRSNILPRIEQCLQEGPCSFQIIEREKPLVWPKDVNPARIVGIVETLQKQFILDRSQMQLSPDFLTNESEYNSSEEIPHECEIVNVVDFAGQCCSSLNDEYVETTIMNQHISLGTQMTTEIEREQSVQNIQTSEYEEIKLVGKTNSKHHSNEVKCIQLEVRDCQNSTNNEQIQINQDSIDSKTPIEIRPSTRLNKVLKSPRNKETPMNLCQRQCCHSTKTNTGEPGRQTATVCPHRLKRNESKTGLFMSAVKRKMSTKVQQKTSPIPDLVPPDLPTNSSSGGRSEQTSNQTGRHIGRESTGMRHHERSTENTSCTLF